MANTGLLDFSRCEDLRLDEICMNSRTGYLFAPVAVNGGSLPANPTGTNWVNGFGPPTSLSQGSNFTLTAFQMSPAIVVVNATAAITLTFDTAANIVGLINARSAGAVVGDIVQCLIINGQGTNTITLAANASGGTYDTNQTASSRVIAGNSSKYVFIRLTNVTPGSEAYTVYS